MVVLVDLQHKQIQTQLLHIVGLMVLEIMVVVQQVLVHHTHQVVEVVQVRQVVMLLDLLVEVEEQEKM